MNKCTNDNLDLKNEKQIESVLELIKDSAEIMVQWEDYDNDEIPVKKSKIIMTDGLMARLKDGRFTLTATEETEESEE